MKSKIKSILALLTFIFLANDNIVVSQDIESRTTKALTINNKVRVAVLGFDDLLPSERKTETQRVDEGLPQELADFLIESINRKQRYNIVEREVIRRVFNEKKFTSNEGYQHINALKNLVNFNRDTSDISEIKDFAEKKAAVSNHEELVHKQENAKTVAADYLLLAKLANFENQTITQDIPGSDKNITINKIYSRLHIRIIDVQKGIIVNSKSVENDLIIREKSKDQYNQTLFFRELSEKAANFFNDTAFPARVVALNPITVNRGKVDEMLSETVCDIKRQVRKISDENSIDIGEEEKLLGKITINDVRETFSQSASNLEHVTIGDRVECHKALQGNNTQEESNGKPSLAFIASLVKDQQANIKEGIPAFKDSLKTELISKLSSTYSVLERENLDTLLSENDLQNFFSTNDKIELPIIKGAQFLLFLSINNISHQKRTQKIKVLDEEIEHETIACEGTFRLVDSKTQNISKSGTFHISERLKGDTNSSHSLVLTKLVADEVIRQITGTRTENNIQQKKKEIVKTPQVAW